MNDDLYPVEQYGVQLITTFSSIVRRALAGTLTNAETAQFFHDFETWRFGAMTDRPVADDLPEVFVEVTWECSNPIFGEMPPPSRYEYDPKKSLDHYIAMARNEHGIVVGSRIVVRVIRNGLITDVKRGL